MKKPRLYKKPKTGAKKFKPVQSEAPKRSSTKLGYDAAWRSYRFRFLHYNKECYACGAKENLHVDHVVPHRGDDKLFKKLDNHIPLCHSCHSYVTAKFDLSYPPNTEGKLRWIAQRRELTGTTSSIRVLSRYQKSSVR